MHLPLFIARPLFGPLFQLKRHQEGSRTPPLRRFKRFPSAEERLGFDALWEKTLGEGPNTLIDYRLPNPKVDFLNYLCDHCGYVAHGSPLPDLPMLEPIRHSWDVTEFGNRKIIFSTPDAVWAMWFAILDKGRAGSTSNACIRLGSQSAGWIKYYHFSLPKNMQGQFPFAEGTIYLARSDCFPERHAMPLLEFFGAEFEEWGSDQPVKPVARLRISPLDFPYLDFVEYNMPARA
jgi:hypothetical protein